MPDLFLGRTLNPIDVDRRALGAASDSGACVRPAGGLLPAWIGTRTDPSRQCAVRARPRRKGARRVTRWLLVAEVALACSLLVGSALLIRSFGNLAHADRGLNLDGVVHVNLSGLDKAFPSPEAMGAGTNAIETQVASWPEVSSFALSREAPPSVRARRLEPRSTDGLRGKRVPGTLKRTVTGSARHSSVSTAFRSNKAGTSNLETAGTSSSSEHASRVCSGPGTIPLARPSIPEIWA